MNKKSILGGLFLSFAMMLLAAAAPPNGSYEGYYLFLGNYPSEANPGWHEDAQGLTHDRDNWFIIQTKHIWKIPVTQDLNSVSTQNPGVMRIEIKDIPQLVAAAYNHFGDPDYYEFEGQGYLLVPIEDVEHKPRIPCNGVAVFTADTLEYVAHQCLPGQLEAPWVAVDLGGNIFSSSGRDSQAKKFSVDWSRLKNRRELILTEQPYLSFLDELGAALTLTGLQGGVVSPSSHVLYLVADAIHVFDLSTGRRIQRSTNGSGHFNYEFTPDCPEDIDGLECLINPEACTCEEPEGITIWDLDDDRAPGIRGQLHVLLLDNDSPSADDIYLKHYSGTICVDRSYSGEEKGTPSKPFKTIGRANDLVNSASWDGAQIKIRAGSYSETPTFSKRIKVLAEGGVVTIGQ